MSFFKSLFKKQDQSEPKLEKKISVENTQSDEAHSLEWRNRYLEARIKYLKTEFSKADKIPPAFPPLPDDHAFLDCTLCWCELKRIHFGRFWNVGCLVNRYQYLFINFLFEYSKSLTFPQNHI